MAVLIGSTDITNFASDIYNILTGAAASGQRGSGQAANGVTLSASEQWTGIDSTNHVIRSQKTESPFSGEYKLYRGCPRFAARATGTTMAADPQQFMGRPTFTGVYNGATARVYFAAFVSTNNSSPGSLSGTVVSWTLVNSATGATVTSGSATGWAGASDTKVLAQGVSLTLTLTAGQTFTAGTNAVMWMRAYSTTHTDGIDYFPEAAQLASALTVSNTTGGANNYTVSTDYEIVQEATAFPAVSTTIGSFDYQREWGHHGAHFGIHWKTGGSPPAAGTNYFIPATYTVYAGYFQIGAPTSSGGNYVLFGGPMQFWDGTLASGRCVFPNTTNGKSTLNTTTIISTLFTGVAQPVTTFINYWIAVQQDKIVFIFRGDTGQGGRTAVFTYQRYTTLVTTDYWPWFFLGDNGAVTMSFLVSSSYTYGIPYWGNPAATLTNIDSPFMFGNASGLAGRITGIASTEGSGLPDNNPNGWDLRWWLYTIYLWAGRGGNNLAGSFDASKNQGIRGKLRDLFVVAEDNFTNLDQLVDGASTYRLAVPSSQDIGSSPAYNAIAMLEA